MGPVIGYVELENADSLVTARGRLHATAVLPCSRCLADHVVELDAEVYEQCSLTQIDEPSMWEAGTEEPIPLLSGDLVDLSELVRQVLVLNVPSRSLCRPDCAGLCPRCGRNLSDGPCGCGEDDVDPRWAGLRDLIDD
ncbi:MAG: DUF177 domain-containing protein [Armatimonadetes bacterium]|nr:DUF177 domain-containing protein [Armatimonadota bacterium]